MKKLSILAIAAVLCCMASCEKNKGNEPFVPKGVDLGLSVKWASCNVGATKPEEYGNYFAWGETKPKEVYFYSTYFDTKDGGSTFIKYNNYGGKTTLDLADDAAHVNWGGNWRMPTKAEQDELRNNCTWTWTTQNGVKGYQVKGKNGYSIFLPAAGMCSGDGCSSVGSFGYYWSSSLYTYARGESGSAYVNLNFCSDYVDWFYFWRCYGYSVRPVCR